jgi:hypothetical protein
MPSVRVAPSCDFSEVLSDPDFDSAMTGTFTQIAICDHAILQMALFGSKGLADPPMVIEQFLS